MSKIISSLFNKLFLSLGVAVLITACANTSYKSAPTSGTDVYFNAKVYTVDSADAWVEALAVQNGKIVATGSSADMLEWAGSGGERIDLQGRMMMPGIHDTHMHPSDAGISKALECSFISNDLEEVLTILKGCVAEAKPGEWVRGGQWNEGYFVNNPKMPKTILDEIAPNNPVFLMDWSVHHAWVNSAALTLFEIEADTPDTEGGAIKRDADTGEAVGLLYDNEAYSKRKLLPSYSLQEKTEALEWSIKQVLSYGITTIKDAIVTDENMAAYQELSRTDRLPVRVKTSLSWKSQWAMSPESEKNLIANRQTKVQDLSLIHI